MSVLIRENHARANAETAGIVAFGGALVMLLVAFLLIPGDLGRKAHLALHGMCAQRPSHSLSLGGNVLPLDARMTGIYLGAVVTIGWLAGARRLRGVGRPPRSVEIILVLGVAAMAGDGMVGLLSDLQLPHPYVPSNALRLATGMSAGIALGAALSHLFAMTVWGKPDRQCAVIGSVRELLVPVGFLVAMGVLLLSGLSVFFTPLAIGLVAAAVIVVAMLNVCLGLLVTGRAWSVDTLADLRGTMLAALLLAVLAIAAMSAVRLFAESTGIVRSLT